MNLRCLSCLMARMTSFTLRPPRICVNRDYNREGQWQEEKEREHGSGICPHNCPTTYVSHYQGRSFIFPLRHLPFMDSLFLSSPMTSSRTIFNGKRERHCWRLISCPQLPGLFIILWLLFYTEKMIVYLVWPHFWPAAESLVESGKFARAI